MKDSNLNIVLTITQDQAKWLKWVLQDYVDSDPEAFLPERIAFIRRLGKKINDQLNAES